MNGRSVRSPGRWLAVGGAVVAVAACSAAPDARAVDVGPGGTGVAPAQVAAGASIPSRPAGRAASSLPTAAGRIVVTLLFDPPLDTDGEVVAVHESGVVVATRAWPSGVELLLPPGPATVRLVGVGGGGELVVHVAMGMAPVVWRWRGGADPPRR